jgi:hypothetical protein
MIESNMALSVERKRPCRSDRADYGVRSTGFELRSPGA